MVADAYCHHFIVVRRFTCSGWQFGYCTIYLFYFLMKKNTRDSIIVLSGLSLLAYLFSSTVLFALVLILLLAILLSEKLMDIILLVWYKIAYVLGYINTRIILLIFYFIVVTPYSRLIKLFNKNKMQIKGEETQFVDNTHTYTAADFENMW